MRWALVGAAAAAVVLAGCGKPASNAAATTGAAAAGGAAVNVAAAPAGTAATAAAPAGGPAGPIALADLPAPTAGQWTRVSSQDGGAPQTGGRCFDGKPIDPTEGMFTCPSLSAQRTATGGFQVSGDCPNHGIDAKLTLSGEGDFKKSFATDSEMVMTGGPGGAMTTKNHSVYTFAGPTCAK